MVKRRLWIAFCTATTSCRKSHAQFESMRALSRLPTGRDGCELTCMRKPQVAAAASRAGTLQRPEQPTERM